MAIDIHSHLYADGFHGESFTGPTAITPETQSGGTPTRSSWRAMDPDGSLHIQRMDEAGIEKAALLHIDFGVLFGEAAMTIEEQNKHVS